MDQGDISGDTVAFHDGRGVRGVIGKAIWYLRDAVDKRDGQRPFPRVELEMAE